MMVKEHGCERSAEVNISKHGQDAAFEEYGQYVNPDDQAICSYVPVEPGINIRIFGKFFGSVASITVEAIIDGVVRNVKTFNAKAKNKKVGFSTFLHLKNDGSLLDTSFQVKPRAPVNTASDDQQQRYPVGCLEIRIYIEMSPNATHEPETDKYRLKTFESSESAVKSHPALYDAIVPQFILLPSTDRSPVDRRIASRFRNLLTAPRPGKRPWAIFRFHYRSIDSIVATKLPKTFDPWAKKASNPLIHYLDSHSSISTPSTRASSPRFDLKDDPEEAADIEEEKRFQESKKILEGLDA